jgi:hypothetical protein
MSRPIFAAALAVALLSLAAADASAGPATSTLFGTPLACAVNASDGNALKIRIVVTNKSGRYIAQGTPITLTILVRKGGQVRRVETVVQNVTAYNNIEAKGSIGFDQPAGAISCTARAQTGINKSRLSVKPHALTH